MCVSLQVREEEKHVSVPSQVREGEGTCLSPYKLEKKRKHVSVSLEVREEDETCVCLPTS